MSNNSDQHQEEESTAAESKATPTESPPPTEKLNITGNQADRLKEEFKTESELVDFIKEGGDITEFAGIGHTTSTRIRTWYENEHPEAYRTQIENDEAIATEFYESKDNDQHDEYLWGFICPNCEEKNPCQGDPAGFKGRPYPCDVCSLVVLLHSDPLNKFIEETVESIIVPEWVPDSYDPTDELWTRVQIIAEIDRDIEIHAIGESGKRVVIGKPHSLEKRHGHFTLCAGGKPHCWEYEVTINKGDKINLLHSIDMKGDVSENEKNVILRGDVDLRIYKVDAPNEEANIEIPEAQNKV